MVASILFVSFWIMLIGIALGIKHLDKRFNEIDYKLDKIMKRLGLYDKYEDM